MKLVVKFFFAYISQRQICGLIKHQSHFMHQGPLVFVETAFTISVFLGTRISSNYISKVSFGTYDFLSFFVFKACKCKMYLKTRKCDKVGRRKNQSQ